MGDRANVTRSGAGERVARPGAQQEGEPVATRATPVAGSACCAPRSTRWLSWIPPYFAVSRTRSMRRDLLGTL